MCRGDKRQEGPKFTQAALWSQITDVWEPSRGQASTTRPGSKGFRRTGTFQWGLRGWLGVSGWRGAGTGGQRLSV